MLVNQKNIKHYHCKFIVYNTQLADKTLQFATNVHLTGLSIEECNIEVRRLITKKHYFLQEVVECLVNHDKKVLETQERLIN